ncbi:class IIb bacteriocin, lactobin A/cerein 7B family [Facklamia sp. P12932]|uniref:class IIb bacteriocin, lactobin A/cerein 7B family n=1 Tax=Facklamia sp. P12932 TaxID=3421947 RepID=UPI003D17CEF7
MENNIAMFQELDDQILMEVSGGFFGPVLFTVWGTKVLVGHALSAGVALGFAALATN